LIHNSGLLYAIFRLPFLAHEHPISFCIDLFFTHRYLIILKFNFLLHLFLHIVKINFCTFHFSSFSFSLYFIYLFTL
jgi:hypothetical protein